MPERKSVTLWRGDIELNVSGLYSKAYPGCMYHRNGDPGDPPEPAEFEIDSITDTDGRNLMPMLEDLWIHKPGGQFVMLLDDMTTDVLERIEDAD